MWQYSGAHEVHDSWKWKSVLDESFNLYEICGLVKVRSKRTISGMFHDSSPQYFVGRDPRLQSPENLDYSIKRYSERWRGLADSDFSRPLSRPLTHHYLHPHFIPLSVIDGNFLSGPSNVSWHTAEGKDSWERGTEGRKGVEDLNFYPCHCKSVLARVYTLHNI